MSSNDIKSFKMSLKNTFKAYRGMTRALRHKLRDLGFTVTDGGKHYKLYYNSDWHHPFVLAKTPSDTRTGLNFASAVIRSIVV